MDLVLRALKSNHLNEINNLKMDRHHLLSLLDKLQEKYELQDGEYKEFAEAIGGKKTPIDISEDKMIKVEYEGIEVTADFSDEEITPRVYINRKCSIIWKIIPDASNHYSRSETSSRCLFGCQIQKSYAKKIAKDFAEGSFTQFYIDENRRKHVIRVTSIEVI